MTSRTGSLLAAVVLTAVVAAPAQGAGIPKTNSCGTVATKNGGKARYIRSYKIGCKTAKAVAGKANGKKSFTASRFTCRLSAPTYLCTKAASKQTIVFTYRKPARKSATASAAASAKPVQCGKLRASNGAAISRLSATRIGCTPAKAVARRANGKKTYTAGRFTCHALDALYLCTRSGTKQTIVFLYRQRS